MPFQKKNQEQEAYKPQKLNDGRLYKKSVSGIEIDLSDLQESEYVSSEQSELNDILNDIDLDELGDSLLDNSTGKAINSTDKEIESNTSSYDKSYKGVKNYLSSDGIEGKDIEGLETINIKAEVLESSTSSLARNSNSSDDPEPKKRRNRALPYSDMFAYYVKGEKVIVGGMKKTTTPTYEDVALKFDCSLESVQKTGRKQQWFKKRGAYREKLQGDFSFYGQMAADINGKVLANSNRLMARIEAKINHPTFMPDPDAILTTSDGKVHVEDEQGKLHYYSGNEGKLHETQILLNMTRSLELINKICNNTVQVEVDNLNLLQNQQISTGQQLSTDPETRMRQVEEIQERLSWGKKKEKGKKLSKAEKVRRMQEGKENKLRSREEKEILDT